jgi:hypothetical protein
MARHELDREDLLREATALVQRVEVAIPGYDEPVVIGFRKDGSVSVFFGAEPVYQFNAANELRRAYVGGLLYKAERGGLVELRRERSESEVALIRRELTSEEMRDFLEAMEKHLTRLRQAFCSGTYAVLRQIPSQANLSQRVTNWLADLPEPVPVAQGPNVKPRWSKET